MKTNTRNLRMGKKRIGKGAGEMRFEKSTDELTDIDTIEWKSF